jgi:simple sugar transport system permease protein
LALVVGAIIILCLGKNPLAGYGYLIEGALSSPSRIAQSLMSACPLIFTGLCVSFAYKCGVFNLGGEGQFIMGATCTLIVLQILPVEGPLGILIGMLAGIIAGGLWGMLPGIMKIARGLNELITTIMLNYIATLFMGYCYSGPFRESAGGNPQTAAVADSLKFLKLDKMHIGVIIAVILAFVLWYVIFKTSFGFKIRAVGINPTAARVAGYPVKRLILLSFIISGAIAGLGGAVELMGKSYRLMNGFGSGFGFTGVAIALIAQLNPIATMVVAIFFGMLSTGASNMQAGIAVPTAIIEIIRALIIIFAVTGMAMLKMPGFTSFLSKLTPMDQEGLKPPTEKTVKAEVSK